MLNKHELLKETTEYPNLRIELPILNKRKKSIRQSIIKALPVLLALGSQQGCTLDREGENLFASNQGGTGGEAGIEGGAGTGVNSDAGTGGTAGSAGESGSAGETGVGGEAGSAGCTPQEEICDGLDNDCDNQIDEDLTPPACKKTEGVCATPVSQPVCEGAQGWSDCEFDQDYEDGTETKCDALDNDCDGETDEMSDLINYIPSCGEPDRGVCANATLNRTCENGQWTECDYGPDYEQGEEQTCDGLDNNCNDITDDSCVTTIHGGNNYEQLVTETGNYNPLDGSTGDEQCETQNTTFNTHAGITQMIYLQDSVNSVTIETLLSPASVETGCSTTLNCPDNQKIWDDGQNITKDTNVTMSVSGNEITLTHTSPCGRHLFFVNW